jgi:hypothetical protein
VLRQLVAGVASLLLLLPAVASADEGERLPQRWYGWQSIIGIVASDGLLLGAAATKQPGSDTWKPLYAIGASGKLLVGPLHHVGHGRYLVALGSFGMTVGAAGVGVVLGGVINAGLHVATPCTSACDRWLYDGFLAGGAIGATFANFVDIAVLSYEPVKRRWGDFSVAPLAVAGGGGVAVSASF